MHFQNLTDIHTGGNTQGIEHDVQRRTVIQERHILLRQDAGNNALVTVAARHFIADGNLAFLRDIATDNFIDTGAQFIAVFAGEDFDIHNDTVFAVRHAQRGVAHLARFLTEDGAQQALLGSQLGFALRGDLTDQNIARVHLGTDTDNPVFVEVCKRVLTDIRNITGDFFRPEFGFAGFEFVFFNMHRGIHIVAHQFFVDEHRVLVVVAFPGHEAD